MKILYIDVNCKSSSTGRIVYNLFSECKKNNIESAICYGRGKKIKEPNIYKFGLDFETLLHAFLTRLTGLTGYYSFFSTLRLINYIKRFKPDIVHIHELHAYFVNVVQLLKFLKKKNYKVVFTNHCEFLYTGKCGLSRDCKRYTESCGKCPYYKSYPSSLFFDFTRKMLLDKKRIFKGWEENVFITAPSKWLSDRSKLSFLKDYRSKVVHNGIDSSFEIIKSNIKKELGISPSDKIVLLVAPHLFSDNKGGYRFVSIAKKMEKYPNIKFIGVGMIEKPNISLPKNTIVLPLIENKEKLIKLYSISNVFLVCSRNENFPTTSLEAQCCGLKVIGYDVGGVKETILRGNGTVVEFDNEEKMIYEILKVLSENYDHNEVSSYSRSCFSDKRMFEEYLKIYKSV